MDLFDRDERNDIEIADPMVETENRDTEAGYETEYESGKQSKMDEDEDTSTTCFGFRCTPCFHKKMNNDGAPPPPPPPERVERVSSALRTAVSTLVVDISERVIQQPSNRQMPSVLVPAF
ncbi:hypothetical protein Bca52824_027665 [Brassica carinata]|uniref:Uncharacterized protein n=1 Tax=Brassica carinata TaxID=52824 RepID=A0A8X8AQK3_BRACI|nr:hypothetical protein Bca52824_027665 [Brassica carinata]